MWAYEGWGYQFAPIHVYDVDVPIHLIVRLTALGVGTFAVIISFLKVGAGKRNAVCGFLTLYVLAMSGSFLVSLATTGTSGFSSYGALLGMTLAVVMIAPGMRLHWHQWLDRVAPYGLLTYAIFRFSCFLKGCCSGTEADVVWAVPDDLYTFSHPVQLYDSYLNMLLFLFVSSLPQKRWQGSNFLFCLAGNSLVRIGVEFFRWEREWDPFIGTYTFNQIMALTTFLAALILLTLGKKSAELKGPQAAKV